MLLEKSSGERLCFSLTVSELAVTLRYSQPGSSAPLAVSFRTEGRISPQRWTHLALQVTHLLGWMTFDPSHKRAPRCISHPVSSEQLKQLFSLDAGLTVDGLANRHTGGF